MTTITAESTIRPPATAGPCPAQPGDAAARSGARRRARRKRFTKHSPAGEVVLAYLDAQAGKLNALDLAVRRDKPDAVHQMRVTVRRLRATLQAFGSVLPKQDTAHLRAELKWLGSVLGAARDNEVLSDHLHTGLKTTPTELVLGPAQARITAHFAPLEASTRQAVLEALDTERYRALRTELDQLLDRPPLTPEAGRPAGKVLPLAIGRACRRTRRRMHRAEHTPAGPARDSALHETRKAAKRARYAAEAARPGLGQKNGKKAQRLGKRLKRVQSALGAHQDAVIARTVARDIGVHAHLSGENAFSFGLLRERAHHQALASEAKAQRAWHRAASRKATRWLPKS